MKKVLSIVLTLCILASMMIAGVSATPETTHSVMINENQLQIFFSATDLATFKARTDPLTSFSAVSVYHNDTLLTIPGAANGGDWHMQWGGTIAWADAEQTSIIFTLENHETSLEALLTGKTGYFGKSINEWLVDYPGAVISFRTEKDGRIWAPITDMNYTPALEIESVELISAENGTIQITFSEPVTKVGECYAALRLQNADDGGSVITVDGFGHAQWGGALTVKPGGDGSVWIWTRDGGESIESILNGTVDPAISAYLAANAGSAIKFMIEESGGTSNDYGYITAFENDNGDLLHANRPVRFGGAFDLTDRFVMSVAIPQEPLPPGDELTIVSATAINETQIKVVFSDEVTIDPSPFMALRLVDENNHLFSDGDTHYQFGGSWEFDGTDKTTIIWTLNESGHPVAVSNVGDIINRTGALADFSDKLTRFCIEEVPTDNFTIEFNGFIDNITSGNLMLSANKTDGINRDGLYVEVVEDYELPEFRLMNAIAINKTQIVLKFSQPVKIEGTPFMALRIIDGNNELQWKGAPGEGTPMQFYGTWKYANTDKDHLIWTLDANNTLGVSDINTILNRTGVLSDWSDFLTVFCLEEVPADTKDKEDGTICNVSNAEGILLYANKIGPGENYDAVYLAVEINPNYEIPNTGDINIILLSGIALTAAAAGAVIVLRKKKTAVY